VRGNVNVGEFGTENEIMVFVLCRLLLFHLGWCLFVAVKG